MNPLALFDNPVSVRLVLSLLHFLWLGSVIAAMSMAGGLALRKSTAAARYVVHVTALLLMFACLPATFLCVEVPTSSAASPNQESTAMADAGESPAVLDLTSAGISRGSIIPDSTPVKIERIQPVAGEPVRLAPITSMPVQVSEARVRVGSHAPPTANVDSTTMRAISWLVAYSPHLTMMYLAGVLAMTMRLMIALRGGQTLRRLAEPVEDAALLAMIERQSRRLGLKMAPAVAYCREISVPIVMGIVHPLILMPATVSSGLTPDQIQSLVTHELAHLRRYDPLVNLLQRLIEAVFFFHPAVWYISGRIDTERENASDDLVLVAGCPRVQYADALVRMAELSACLRRGRVNLHSTAISASGSNSSEFKRRIVRLLEGERTSYRLTGWGIFLVLMWMAAGTSTLVLATAWAMPTNQAAGSAEAPGTRPVGHKIDNFRLRDYLGREHQLDDFSDSRLVAVVFLGVDCPLAKLYGARLAELAEKYKPQRVAFLGVNSNLQDTPTDVGLYVRQHGIKFPLLKDPGNKIADQFGAERTPEVFLLDDKHVVRYWGSIDDQFGVGYARPTVTQKYLSDAIDALLSGQQVKNPESDSVGCRIGRVIRKPPTGEITYTNQVARILERRCVECHRDGGIAPFAMSSYDEVAGWAETMRDVVASERMPPWHANPSFGQFSNDHRMPEEEKRVLYQWIENGVPEGVPVDLPPLKKVVDNWSLGPPDLIASMPSPFTVSPDGVVSYQYFTVDPGFTEGKWIRASEVMPGVRSVVHHVIVFIDPPGGDPILEEKGVGFEMVGAYVPGTPPMQLEDGVARFVPAGSKFVFQMHYTPDGSERKDQTKIGLYFADPAKVQRTVQTAVAVNLDFTIPANASEYQIEASHRFDHDTQVHALTPHMHFRGKSFRFEAIYPNGAREILLDVPRFDFNWQNTYRLAHPKLLPEGTLLKCFAVFDNSSGNRSNPDPSIPVKWGEQTWEEMMIGYVECVFLNQDLSLPEPEITPIGNDEYRVVFRYRPDRPVRTVHLAGTFNEWNTSSHPLTDPEHDGVFTTEMRLKQGPHRYKFVVDGNYWTHDPASRILTGFFHESFFVAGPDVKHESASQK